MNDNRSIEDILKTVPLKKPKRPRDSSPKVLIVDDEADIRVVISDFLQQLKFNVIEAADGVEGWNQYLAHSPDIVITDIYMPRKNGLALLSQIKSHDPQQVVIVITGYYNYEQMVKNHKTPPDGFLKKPFSAASLYESIMRAFGKM